MNIIFFLDVRGRFGGLAVLVVSTHFRGCESGETQKSGGGARVASRPLPLLYADKIRII